MLLTPSLAGILLFYGIPLLDVARRSFCDGMGKHFVGLSNFRQILKNQAFRLALYNTMRYELVCLPLLLSLSLFLALLVWKLQDVSRSREVTVPSSSKVGTTRVPTLTRAAMDQGLLRPAPGTDRVLPLPGASTALVLPLALPSASMVLVWQILLCREGVLDQFLGWLTASVWERDWTDGPWAFGVLVATYLWKNAGYDMLLWLSGLRAIPGQLYEAAKIDGAGRLERFRYITMPCLRGTAKLVLMLSLTGSFKVFREAFLLSGSYPHESIYLFQHLFNHWFVEMDVQKMCTAAFLMLTAGAAGYQVIWRYTGQAVRRCVRWKR